MLNPPEKIAALYLRLNHFFLLPHFTLLALNESGSQTPEHSDFLALRMPGAHESIGRNNVLTDDRLLDHLDRNRGLIRIVAEVKGGAGLGSSEKNLRSHFEDTLNYARGIFGIEDTGIDGTKKLLFRKQDECFSTMDDIRCVSLRHCLFWIYQRLENTQALTESGRSKGGTWTWSEESLAELLYNFDLSVYEIRDHRCS
jgi:hypothetical protein